MGNSTLKSKVEYGAKAVVKVISPTYSTAVSTNGQIEIKMNYGKDSSIDSGFRKVDFSDQKRQDAYRRINRMMGGY